MTTTTQQAEKDTKNHTETQQQTEQQKPEKPDLEMGLSSLNEPPSTSGAFSKFVNKPNFTNCLHIVFSFFGEYALMSTSIAYIVISCSLIFSIKTIMGSKGVEGHFP